MIHMSFISFYIFESSAQCFRREFSMLVLTYHVMGSGWIFICPRVFRPFFMMDRLPIFQYYLDNPSRGFFFRILRPSFFCFLVV